MKFIYISLLLFVSLSIPNSLAHAAGVSVPTFSAVLAKAAGSIIAFSAIEFLEQIKEHRLNRINEPASISDTQLAGMITPQPTEIQDIQQSTGALIVTGITFFVIIAWNIKSKKQLQQDGLTDKQEIETEKA